MHNQKLVSFGCLLDNDLLDLRLLINHLVSSNFSNNEITKDSVRANFIKPKVSLCVPGLKTTLKAIKYE
jgi:hypothetical protein